MSQKKSSFNGFEIAVIGMAGKFPGANDTEEFWDNIKSSVESIEFLDNEELLKNNVSQELINSPEFVKTCGAILNDKDCFDSNFFRISDTDADLMHPQSRVMHECVWNALEDAGYVPDSVNDTVGFYVGGMSSSLWEFHNHISKKSEKIGTFASSLLTERDYLHTRISYNFNFKGPSLLVQTTCSTALVAIHLGCRSLLMGECNMAVAGAVRLDFSKQYGYSYEEGMVFSPDGHCRAFDKDAKGIVKGEGVGVVVLKRLKDAIADKDNIHCIIKGTSINNDGNRKIGYTAPSINGQADVIKVAQKFAEVEPESVSYIEAHGTGTDLGDLIELDALKNAFNSQKKSFCAIGSVKANIGHAGEASGIASFIKTTYALKNKLLPPSINCIEPNPKIGFENSPFYVNTQLKDWKSNGNRRRAGISSFGIGGTNAHVILEESSIENKCQDKANEQLVLISANSLSALERNTSNLVKFVKENKQLSLFNLAYTLQIGRKNLKFKKMIVCSGLDDLQSELNKKESGNVYSNLSEKQKQLIFMFPGQGNQYISMGRDLYENEQLFKEEMDKCFNILDNLGKKEIKSILFVDNYVLDKENINQIDVAPIVNFIVEFSLATFLINKGIKPYACIGHSVGEYVAACLSGVFSLEDAIKMVLYRGELMKTLPEGLMLSVPVEKEKISEYLVNVSLAADHGSSCVVSGSCVEIEDLEIKLKSKRMICQRLPISHAGHSESMNSILNIFKEKLKEITFNTPVTPYISTVTGGWAIAENVTSPEYWANQVKDTVQIADGLKVLTEKDEYIYLELGPGNSLATIVSQYLTLEQKGSVLTLLRFPLQKISDTEHLLFKIGKAWLQGYDVNWTEYYGCEKHQKLSLPKYSFDKKVFGFDNKPGNQYPTKLNEHIEDLSEDRNDLSNWFYLPSWKPVANNLISKANWIEGIDTVLIFNDKHDLGFDLAALLKIENVRYIIIEQAKEFVKHCDIHYSINPDSAESYKILFDYLQNDSIVISKIIHLWGYSAPEDIGTLYNRIDKSHRFGYISLLNVIKEIGNHKMSDEIDFMVVTNNMQSIQSGDLLCPEKSTVIGPVRVIPLEYKNVFCVSVDVDFSEVSWKKKLLSEQLLSELKTGACNQIISFRGSQKYIQHFEPVKLESNIEPDLILKENGVYLITGGLGYVGLNISEYLAKTVKAKLILTSRSGLIPRKEWEEYLYSHQEFDLVSCRIRKLIEIENFGAEVSIHQVDVTDMDEMYSLHNSVIEKYGKISGVLHCAMHPEGAVIHKMEDELSERVFAPKIKGSIVLAELFKNTDLDFMVLCSSQHSFMGKEVSYNSANNFVDAFAHSCSSIIGIPATSINWCNWSDIDSVFNYNVHLIESAKFSKLDNVLHPLMSGHLKCSPDIELFKCELDPIKDWVLNEHRISKKATLVGTAYLEMVYQAFKYIYNIDKVSLQDVQLNNTIDVEDTEKIEVYVVLKKWNNKVDYSILSKIINSSENWKENVTGTISALDEDGKKIDLSKVKSRSKAFKFDDIELSNDNDSLVSFGKRWTSIEPEFYSNDDEGLIKLKLHENYLNDLRDFELHPSIIDRACGYFASMLAPEETLFLPIHYKEIKIYGSIGDEIYCYSNAIAKSPKINNLIKLSVDIFNPNGQCLISISDYTLLDVTNAKSLDEKSNQNNSEKDPLFEDELHGAGISGKQGVEIFNRVLNNGLPQVLLSRSDFNSIMSTQIDRGIEPSEKTSSINHKNTVTSALEIENAIKKILMEILGIENINVNDNFFEIGANSLTIISLNTKLKGVLKREMSIVDLYTYPSVSDLTQFLVNLNVDTISKGRKGSKRVNLSKRKNRIKKR